MSSEVFVTRSRRNWSTARSSFPSFQLAISLTQSLPQTQLKKTGSCLLVAVAAGWCNWWQFIHQRHRGSCWASHNVLIWFPPCIPKESINKIRIYLVCLVFSWDIIPAEQNLCCIYKDFNIQSLSVCFWSLYCIFFFLSFLSSCLIFALLLTLV